MYRFHHDLNLDSIVNDHLVQIRQGIADVQLVFNSGTIIVVESRIEFKNETVNLSSWNSVSKWSSTAFQQLLNCEIKSYGILDPKTLQLNFEDNLSLKIYDDSDQFESVTIYLFNDQVGPITI